MNCLVLPAAEREAVQAAIWYEEQRIGLGAEFLAELEQALARIRTRPESCGRLEHWSGPRDIRRCTLSRFPYLVVFERRPQDVLIVAVSHARRRPFYWLERFA
ncbi:MAG: type II toxin-antitoxin system RelE/ParE family toxin [Planctomycetaceae bacterium]|nr:type II toxin-antitoxin system RelE/ParE family toxin [Planctomycetaceae bacterium]